MVNAQKCQPGQEQDFAMIVTVNAGYIGQVMSHTWVGNQQQRGLWGMKSVRESELR